VNRMSRIKVIQKKGVIAESKHTRSIIQSLGLKGIRSTKIHKDNNCIRGMINRVIHLVDYEIMNTENKVK
jgi:large subunit ribosomal protein L30